MKNMPVMHNNISKLHLYYQQRGLLPTYARLVCEEDLDKYQAGRENLFWDKLRIPPQLFQGASLIEFGPDSGENALVFAKWGALLTLVEPNPRSWPCIEDYFRKFGLNGNFKSLEKVDLESYKASKKFSFIDAEGFIYTIRPESIWISLFDKILEDNGLFIISYCESFGSMFELMLKLIYSRARQITALESRDIAWRLFETKWNSIPHTRSFDSWLMDVLENPFVRLKYFFSAGPLCTQLAQSGFSLYSSWPNYVDMLDVYWHKKESSPDEKLAQNLDFISRSSLSFIFGKKLFFASESSDDVEVLNSLLWEIVSLIDRSIDDFDADSIENGIRLLNRVRDLIVNRPVIANSSQSKQGVFHVIDSINAIFKLLVVGDANSLISFCNSDGVFIKSWGLPAHFAVFRRSNVLGKM